MAPLGRHIDERTGEEDMKLLPSHGLNPKPRNPKPKPLNPKPKPLNPKPLDPSDAVNSLLHLGSPQERRGGSLSVPPFMPWFCTPHLLV